MSIIITTLALGAAKFLVESTANHFLGKGLDKIFSKDEFQEELRKVIVESLSEYEEKYPIQNEDGKFPFYQSSVIINELFKIRLFKEDGDIDKIIIELKQNNNIIYPNDKQMSDLLDIFFAKTQENNKLRKLNIESNYKSEIFEISKTIQDVKSTLTSVISEISTCLTEEWKRQLNVYKNSIEQFKPKTALDLLDKLEIAIKESGNVVSPNIHSKLHYLKALCYELLLEIQNAQKEYLKCYSKDDENTIYKEKAAFVYYSLENFKKAQELADEIIQIDFNNPFANFILSISNYEITFINNIKNKPEYIRKNETFIYLILNYILKKDRKLISLHDFLLDSFNSPQPVSVNYGNFFSSIHNIEYAYYVYFSSGLFMKFNERTKSSPLLEFIHNQCKEIIKTLKDTEVEGLYKGLFYWYFISDYIVNDNSESLVLAKTYLRNGDVNCALLLANCLQQNGQEAIAIEILSSFDNQYSEILFIKAFCYAKIKDYINYSITLDRFICQLDIISIFNVERLLPILSSLFYEEKIKINFDLIFAKEFELNIHKQIIENIYNSLNNRDNANSKELFLLASDSNISSESKAVLAYILLLTDNYDLSVNLYRQFIDKKIYDQNLYFYIQALYNTKKHNKELLSLLKDWRISTNQPDDFLLNTEYELRRKLNDWEESLEIMKLIYSKYPYRETVFSNYLVCLHEVGDREKIIQLKDNISSIKFVNLNSVRDVAIVLYHNGFIKDAFELIYPFAKNKENSKIRMLFLSLCLQTSEQTVLKRYETVIEDCYVLIKYEETNEIKSVHIKKDTINEMQKALLGHKVNDKVVIKIPTCDLHKTVIIADIINNYLSLNYEIYHETDNPIDSNLPMTSFHLPENCDAEKLNDFFIKNFAASEDTRKQLLNNYLSKYKSGELQFSAIAVLFDSDYLKTYYLLASKDYGILLNPNITDMALINLFDKKFVLDFTAVLCFFELSKKIALSFKNKFIISKSIYDFIQNKIVETTSNPETKMTIDISFKGVLPTIYPENHKEQLLSFYENIKQWINSNCEIEIVEERLDEIRRDRTTDLGNNTLAIEYIADYMHILNQVDRILITDDSMMHMQYGQQNREISSQFYLNYFYDDERINRELLKMNYIGVSFDEKFLKTEFTNKLSGKENVYIKCLDSLCYLLPQNKEKTIIIISSFLKGIYTDSVFVQDIHRETIGFFVSVLKNCVNDITVFISLQKKISRDFNLLGIKKDEVLTNLLCAMRILIPNRYN